MESKRRKRAVVLLKEPLCQYVGLFATVTGFSQSTSSGMIIGKSQRKQTFEKLRSNRK